MHKKPSPPAGPLGGHYNTETHDVLDGNIKVFRTIHSGKVWQMSCWVKEQQKYFRKSLRTKNLDEAKQLATEEYVEIRARLRNGEMVFSKTASALVEEFLKDELSRVRPTGRHQGGITQGRYELKCSVLKRHFLPFVGLATKMDKIDPLSFKNYFNSRWSAQPNVRSVTLKNERGVITALYRYAIDRKVIPPSRAPVFEKLAVNTQKYVGKDDSRDAFTVAEFDLVYKHVIQWTKKIEDEIDRSSREFVRDFILIAANTGLRFGELRKLKWNMVNVYDEAKNKNVKIMVPPDTKTGARPVHGKRGDIFERIRKYSNYTGNGDFVFVDNENGEPLGKNVYYRLWKEIMSATGLDKSGKKLTYYSLRHTYCTFRLLAGVDVFLLARNMGTSVKYIEEHYGHVDLDVKRKDLTKGRRMTGGAIKILLDL